MDPIESDRFLAQFAIDATCHRQFVGVQRIRLFPSPIERWSTFHAQGRGGNDRKLRAAKHGYIADGRFIAHDRKHFLPVDDLIKGYFNLEPSNRQRDERTHGDFATSNLFGFHRDSVAIVVG